MRIATAAVSVLLLAAACTPPTQRLHHRAAAADVVLPLVRPGAEPDAPLARIRRVGVVLAPERRAETTGGILAQAPDRDAALPAAERDTLARLVAELLRRAPALGGADVAVLPDATRWTTAQLREEHGIDLLCVVGFDQSRRISNSRLMLLEVALLMPPYMFPTLRSETLTMVDVLGIRLQDGRAIVRAGATSREVGRAVPMFAGPTLREQRLLGLRAAVEALGPELEKALATPDPVATESGGGR